VNNERLIHYALTGAVGLISGVVGTLGSIHFMLSDLRENDQRQDITIERIDREGTQVSRSDRVALMELKLRFDRMESNQAVALASGARVEALLLDLKQRLRQ
jgi:predicted secreted acid phosphatase